MRHRAALGITESTDAVVVVVSEEHGEVSLTSNGRMVPELDGTRLNRPLHRLLDLEEEEAVTVVLRGPLPILNAITTEDVSATVDAAGMDAITAELTVVVQTPEEVFVVTVRPPTLSVTLGGAPLAHRR